MQRFCNGSEQLIMSLLSELKEDIASVIERDPAARGALEVVFCYPGFHVLLFHRLAARLWAWNFKFGARWLASFARFFTGIEIHPAAKIGRRVFIDHGFGVVIGETAIVEDDVTIYQGVTLGGISLDKGPRHPHIGKGAIIGAGAKVLGPITIGEGARVGSNAVVVDSVPARVTVIGVPAHPVSVLKDFRDGKAAAFDAYGTPCDGAVDPVLQEIEKLRAEIAELKAAQKKDDGAVAPKKNKESWEDSRDS